VTAHAERLMEFLASEGYRPTLRPDGGIAFKHDGGHYLIRFDPRDDQYYAIAYPDFWRVAAAEELTRALRAANRATIGIKAVKLIVFEEERQVWATVEAFASGPAEVEAMFPHFLGVLQAGAARFAEEMRASEPLESGRIDLARGEVARFQHGN
jgi:hypothetical protein